MYYRPKNRFKRDDIEEINCEEGVEIHTADNKDRATKAAIFLDLCDVI